MTAQSTQIASLPVKIRFQIKICQVFCTRIQSPRFCTKLSLR